MQRVRQEKCTLPGQAAMWGSFLATFSWYINCLLMVTLYLAYCPSTPSHPSPSHVEKFLRTAMIMTTKYQSIRSPGCH